MKKMSEIDVDKYYKRYEAALASRVTETLVDCFLKLTCKAVGMAVKIDDTEKLHGDLKNDYIIQQDFYSWFAFSEMWKFNGSCQCCTSHCRPYGDIDD